jgi:hypothetical protein
MSSSHAVLRPRLTSNASFAMLARNTTKSRALFVFWWHHSTHTFQLKFLWPKVGLRDTKGTRLLSKRLQVLHALLVNDVSAWKGRGGITKRPHAHWTNMVVFSFVSFCDNLFILCRGLHTPLFGRYAELSVTTRLQ